MTGKDLDVIDPGDLPPVTFEERAHAAAAGIRRATDVAPPALRTTSTAQRMAQLGAAAAVVAAVIAAAAFLGRGIGSHRVVTAPRPALTLAARQARSAQVVHQLSVGQYQQADAAFTPELQQVRDPLRLRAGWRLIVQAYGAFRSQGKPVVVSDQGFNVPIELAHGHLWIGVVFDQTGRISAFSFIIQGPLNPATTAALESRAAAMIHQLAAGDFQAATATFDPILRVEFSASELKDYWERFERAYGPFESQGKPTEPYEASELINVPITRQRAMTYFQVGFDDNAQVSSLGELDADANPSALAGGTVPLSSSARALAAGVVADLRAGRFAAIAARLGPVGAANLTAAQLQRSWLAVTGRLGPIGTITDPAVAGLGTDTILYEIGVTFDHGQAHVQVEIDDHQRVEDVTIRSGPPTRISGQ